MSPDNNSAANGHLRTVQIGGVDYAIDESAVKIEQAVATIRQALTDSSFAEVPVLDSTGKPAKLFINGAATGAVLVGLAEGPPKPGEMS